MSLIFSSRKPWMRIQVILWCDAEIAGPSPHTHDPHHYISHTIALGHSASLAKHETEKIENEPRKRYHT